MKSIMSNVVAFVFFQLLAIKITFCSGSSFMGCIESEREALLKFKGDIEDPSKILGTWTRDSDCCTWAGVICNNLTGHVQELHLGGYHVGGKINPSLQAIKHLIYLDLSYSNFEGIQIPRFLGSMRNLRYLYLSEAGFMGPIPPQLGNLSNLQYLDLSLNDFNSSIPSWLYKFSRLEYLSLRLSNLGGKILDNLGNLTSLRILDLSRNKLNQEVSEVLNIFSISVGLKSLNLGDNQLFGHLTDQLGQLKNIETLDLSSNNISGHVPTTLGELSSLRILDLSYNKLNGTLSEIHFNNLANLEQFSVSENSLMWTIDSEWIPPFQLTSLELRSCHLGTRFPFWLSTQRVLSRIDMSNTKLFDRIPAWLLNSSSLEFLFLSHNQIHGVLPRLTTSIMALDLSSNNLSGPLHLKLTDDLAELDLSDNAFSGSIFNLVCNDTKYYFPQVLNLRNNLFSGEIPDCWSKWTNLQVLSLDNNKFKGFLPNSLGISSLRSLHLHKNHLSGTIPSSFRNCTRLQVLDLSENELVGNVPSWIGESFSNLSVLNLHSNKFHGPLPLELCGLRHLQILYLADNNLSGGISECVSNFSAMVTDGKFEDNHINCLVGVAGVCIENALLMMKGQVEEYGTILKLVKFIDLSRNNLSGEIPEEVTNLAALQSLNLSRNSFTGKIPKNIGAMKSLESIDFSTNQLTGEIPGSISNLSFLSYLNLSNNNLIGEIPLSTQLQSFDPSCFAGNELCGTPLPKCPRKHDNDNENENGGDEEGNEHEVKWFYVSMALGFVVGFWGFVAPLFLCRRWRLTYYGFLSQLYDRLYFIVARIFY